MAGGFVHLHLHSEYSLLDGACRIKDIISHAVNSGQCAVALTDHGVMYGCVDFYNEAVRQGIKPVIGCEVYVAKRTRHDRVHQYDSSPYHLVLLCENNTGYQNLVKMVSESFVSGFYSKPRVDIELLEKYHEGLICLSACMAGEIAVKLSDNEYESARKTAEKYRDIFGKDNYFLEIQNHGIADQKRILPMLYRLSAETGIPLCATNDVHYTEKSDSHAQKVLVCIQTNTTLEEPSSVIFPTDEFYMKTEEEMLKLFPEKPEAVYITSEIAGRCNVSMEFGVTKLPEFFTEGCSDNSAFFRDLCIRGLHERYGDSPSCEIVSRMEYEISVIEQMGYTDYFLIVWDFISYARKNGIPVGPGRGSGAGSLCAYCIGITGIDPIRYNLIFERFLNPERVSMPDFDVDFCVERRNEVISYVISKYGADKVAQIITFDTMAAKSVIRDVGRVMGLSYSVCDSTAKLIPGDLNITIEKAIEKEPALREIYDKEQSVRRLIDTARRLEGMPRNISIHAAGVVIAPEPVSCFVPLRTSRDGNIITQYPMAVLEKLGMLKVDFLGLRNLTIINFCEKIIRNTDMSFDVNGIPTDDREVFRMLSRGETAGVFQFESQGIRSLLMKLEPESIEDLTAALSLYRPGPMDSIPKYIRNKKDPSQITYRTPELNPILEVTYGCIVYQEQVMEIFRSLAGYTYGRADIVRRAVAKKKLDEMQREREFFVNGYTDDEGKTVCPGAVANGISREAAEGIFDDMISFASYAFNKSHAASYAYLSYQTAYLRCHYFKEYMAALMTYSMSSPGKLMEYISECSSGGIKLIRPSVNESSIDFTVTDEGIRFGLSAIKNIGKGIVEEIIRIREAGGRFESVFDFFSRTSSSGISRRMAESLINSGALDSLGLNRRQMTENIEQIMESHDRDIMDGQLGLFGESENFGVPEIPYSEEYSLRELLKMEKEATGMYISGNPLEQYQLFRKLMRIPDLSEYSEDPEKFKDESPAEVIAAITSVKTHLTKKNDKMLFVTLEDIYGGELECVIFPKIYTLYGKKLRVDEIVYLTGKLSVRDGRISLIAETVYSENETSEILGRRKLCIKTESSKLQELTGLIADNAEKGNTSVCFFLTDIRKLVTPKEKITIYLTNDILNTLRKATDENNIGLIL